MKDICDVPRDRLGSVVALESGATTVRFVRHMPFSAQQVWQAIADPDALVAWFPGFQLEDREGGAYSIWFDDACEGPAHVRGTVSVYDPPRALQCGDMRWQIASKSSGCQLTFVDVLQFGQGGLSDFEITNSVLGGWHLYLDRLEASIAGTLDAVDSSEYDYSQIDVPGRAEPR